MDSRLKHSVRKAALLNTDKKRDKLGFLFSEKKKLPAKINQSIINMNKLPKIKYSVICKPAKVAVVKYEPKVSWFQNPSILYSMAVVRETMETLLGTNEVRCMDREYLKKLRIRILENAIAQLNNRIRDRENKEYLRIKNLVLTGKIPFENAPESMSRHVLLFMEKLSNELISRRRAGYKILKPKIPSFLYWDDTPELPSKISVERGHNFRPAEPPICKPIEMFFDKLTEEETENLLTYYRDNTIKILEKQTLISQMYDMTDTMEITCGTDSIVPAGKDHV